MREKDFETALRFLELVRVRCGSSGSLLNSKAADGYVAGFLADIMTSKLRKVMAARVSYLETVTES